jgi:serine/threonine protein kinase
MSRTLPHGYGMHEYQIQSVLGKGGFGVTYLAQDSNLNTRVAIKEYLPDDLASRQEDNTVTVKANGVQEFQHGLKRFMDEARTLASFRHPNIVRVWRFFEANQTGYMVMEFVDGSPLHEWVSSRRPLPREVVLAMTDQLLGGLDVIHRNGYLHRDIKPNNIFVREDGSPVLIDFGSARRARGNEGGEMTALVTAGYAPLEQYYADGKQGPWSDLYAFASVLYWMVTARKPVEAVARVRQDNMEPAQKVGDVQRYGTELLGAIDWALTMDETKRPQNVAEFRAALGLGNAALDKTVITPMTQGAPPTGHGFTGTVLDIADIKQVETELAAHIGPIASVVVRQAAKRTASLLSFVETVAAEIPDDAKRAVFIKRIMSSTTSRPPTKPPAPTAAPARFSAEVLTNAEKQLAQYIGAIAKVIVKRAAAKARDVSELYLLIADEIESPSERQAFIRKAISTKENK